MMTRIGYRYDLLDKLGQGGMGIVYRARDRLTDSVIALKSVTRGAVVTDQDASAAQLAMAKEFRVAAGLRHPHILSVLDYGFDERQIPYFTMPLLSDAQTLTAAAEGCSIEQKTMLLADLLRALIYLHRHHIIHRDLKPANILVVPDEGLKVVDFGIAIQGETVDQSRVVGTLTYIAPEVFNLDPPTPQSDLYAVGVIAFELFAGRLPFQASSPLMLMRAVMTQQAPLDDLPVSPDLVLFIGRLLSKMPEDRYGSAVEALNALVACNPSISTQESAEIRESFLQAAQFVGRQQELAQLTQALDDLVAGKGSAWLIGGESGVGKSRLIEEIRIQALVKGLTVLRGQAVQGGGLRYQLWRDVLARLVLTVPVSDLEAGVLREVVPSISRLLEREIPPVPELLGTAQQQRLQQTIRALFQRQTQPVLLLLEDLQWTAESLDVLKALLPDQDKLLVIATYRDDERPDLPQQIGIPDVIRLRRFSDDEIEMLSESMLGDAGQRTPVLDLLQRETEGNAFFMIEVMRALAEDVGRLDDIGRKTLPREVFTQGIESLIRKRIARAPHWAYPLLQIAAVAGRLLDLALLSRFDVPYSLDGWLQVYADVQVLERVDDDWRFSHDKIRAQVLKDIDPDELPILHRQVAESIESLYPDDTAHADVLFHHWQMAGDRDKELFYLNKVVEWLLWFGAKYDQAQELIDYGLTLLPENDVRRVHLLNHLSELEWRKGAFADAKIHAEEAYQAGMALEAFQYVARTLGNLGIVARMQGDLATAERYFQESLDLRQQLDDELGVSRSLANLGVVAFQRQDLETARRYYEQSLEIQQRLGERAPAAQTIMNIAQILSTQGDHDLAREYLEQSLTISRELGFRYNVAMALNSLGLVSVSAGDQRAGYDYLRQSLEVFREIKDRYAQAFTLASLANNAPLDDPDFRRWVVDALAISGQIGAPLMLTGALLGAARYLLVNGHVETALEAAGLVRKQNAWSLESYMKAFMEMARERLTDADIEAEMARGEMLELATTAARVLDEIRQENA